MANIVKCVRHKPPMGFESGSAPNSYSAQWRVELDDEVPFTEMLRLARLVVAMDENRPIPRKGDFYSWQINGGARDTDKSALALEFDCTELLDDSKSWIVIVRWRQPVPGAGEEPRRVRTTRDHTRAPNADKREPYRWIEYFTELKDVIDAQNLRSFGSDAFERPRLTKGPITTAAGEEVDKVQNELQHSVFVTERIVDNQLIAHRLNRDFTGAINQSSFFHPMLGTVGASSTGNITSRVARFLRAETSQYPFWEGGQEWFTMQVRVEVQATPFQIDVLNRGILIFDPLTSSVIVNRDTDGVVQVTNLELSGQKAVPTISGDKPDPPVIPYTTHRVKSFNSLTRFL